MIKVTFKIDGKEVRPDQIADTLEKSIVKSITQNIVKELSSVYCSEHGRYPEVTVIGKTLDKLSFQIHGCCQDIIDRATNKLK